MPSNRFRITPRDTVQAVVHATALSAACLISWLLAVGLFTWGVGTSGEPGQLAGMWAVISTVFVYRVGYQDSVRAAVSRAVATFAGLVLCLSWLLVLPAGVGGLVVVIGIGTCLMLILGRPDDVVATGVTTAVVMVIAMLGPAGDAWEQPILRAADTAVGVAVGLIAAWCTRQLSTGTGIGTGTPPER